MATISTTTSAALPAVNVAATGKAYFLTDNNKFVVNTGSAWVEVHSDGTGALPFSNAWGANFSSDYLEPASNPNLDIYSLSIWFKPSSTITSGYSGTLVGGINSVYGGIRLGMGANRTLEYNDGALYIAANTATIDTNWHHLAMVYVDSGYTTISGTASNNGKGYKLFLDGSRVDSTLGSTSYNYSLGSTTAKFKLAREGERGLYFFGGLMDEFAVFGSSLSDSDVSDIYNSGTPVDLGADGLNLSPDMYCRMGDDSNDSPSNGGNIATITDSSGNGNHLTQSTASSQPTFSDLTGETIYS